MIKKVHSYQDFYENIIEKCNNEEFLTNDDLTYIQTWDKHISDFHRKRIIGIKVRQTEFIKYVDLSIDKIVVSTTHVDDSGSSCCKPSFNDLYTIMKSHYEN